MKRITLLLTVLFWSMIGYAAAEDYGESMGTVQNALENNRTNQSSTWVNPDTGESGAVAPLRTFVNDQGLPCREFQQTIVIGGREEQGYGTACRQPDGTWRIVSGPPEASTAPAEQRTTVYVREVARPYPYYPYGYAPFGYAYPYWYPYSFSLNLGYLYRDGGHHHGGYYGGGHYKGGHYKGGHYKGGHYKGGHYRGGHRR